MQLLQRAYQRFQSVLNIHALNVVSGRSIHANDLFEKGSFYLGNTSFVVADIDDNTETPLLRIFERKVGTSERGLFLAVVNLKEKSITLDAEHSTVHAGDWVKKMTSSLWPELSRLN